MLCIGLVRGSVQRMSVQKTVEKKQIAQFARRKVIIIPYDARGLDLINHIKKVLMLRYPYQTTSHNLARL